MPRFHFDILGRERTIDEDGIVLEDPRLIPKAALRTLLEVGAPEVVTNDARALSVSVRDEAGNIVYRASLNVEAGWSVD